MLDELECVETVPSAGRHFHINESTVRPIKRSQAAIRASTERRALRSAEVTYKSCDPRVEKAKKALSLWIKGMTQRFMHTYIQQV
jgi:hypothetical protein